MDETTRVMDWARNNLEGNGIGGGGGGVEAKWLWVKNRGETTRGETSCGQNVLLPLIISKLTEGLDDTCWIMEG